MTQDLSYGIWYAAAHWTGRRDELARRLVSVCETAGISQAERDYFRVGTFEYAQPTDRKNHLAIEERSCSWPLYLPLPGGDRNKRPADRAMSSAMDRLVLQARLNRQDHQGVVLDFMEVCPISEEIIIPPSPPDMPPPLPDPFDEENLASGPAAAGRCDELLAYLTALGRGSWGGFVRACEAMGLADSFGGPTGVMRRLVLLGHVELGPHGDEWGVCRPGLVTLADGRRCWCGARPGVWLDALREAGSVTETAQPAGDGPVRVLVDDSLDSDTFELSDAGDAAATLTNLLPGVDGWLMSLPTIEEANLRGAELQWFDGVAWLAVDAATRGGLYRVTLPGLPGSRLMHRDSQGVWRRGEFSGLRFLGSDRAAVLRDGTVEIPVGRRWPRLYERALVLASGLLPQEAGGWSRYGGIPEPLAMTLGRKLGVEWQ